MERHELVRRCDIIQLIDQLLEHYKNQAKQDLDEADQNWADGKIDGLRQVRKRIQSLQEEERR